MPPAPAPARPARSVPSSADKPTSGRIRVAIVAPSMRILGGQAVQAQRLLDAWRHDPDVVAWLVPIDPLPPRGVRWAVRVKYLRTLVTQLTYWPLLVRDLRQADLVHVFSASYFSFLLAPLPAVLVAKVLRRPVLLNYRSGEAPDHLKRSAIARRTLKWTDANVVPSPFLRGVFDDFGITGRVVPNIVDLDRFRFRLRSPLRPQLVSTRNFESLYNVACTLRAFRLVQDVFPAASLTLVGSGSLDGPLRSMARSLNLQNVTFAGRVPPSDIWRYYADADIYVQTPDIDNMPSSVLEAFASGTPVVSTNAGGVPAIVTDGEDGLLVPADDHQAVARQILRLLQEPELGARLATSARERCARYTWPRVRGEWVEVYREVTGRRVRGSEGPTVRLRSEGPTVRRFEGPKVPPSREALRRASRTSEVSASDAAGGENQAAMGHAFGPAAHRKSGRLARLRSTDSRELAFRARTLVTRGVRRLDALIGGNRWRREELADRLVQTQPGLGPALGRLWASDWAGAQQELACYFRERPARFVLDPRSSPATISTIATRFPRSTTSAVERAERLAAGEYDLLGYRGLKFQALEASQQAPASRPHEPSIDWKLDPVHRRRAADRWWSQVAYLDPVNGDHKIIWELNRHQHWLALGRAYWLSGDERYRSRFVAEIASWVAQNPPLVGINWASMLELSLRCLSWIWALHFFVVDPGPNGRTSERPACARRARADQTKVGHSATAGPDDTPWLVDLLLALDRQMRHVAENLSSYFSPNTHLTGEALGLYVVGRVFPEFASSRQWEEIGRRILIEEATKQVEADGGHAERSLHYHRYTLDFYLLALAVALRTGDHAAEAVFSPLVVRLARFARAMADDNGHLPRIGDDDAGTLMPICGEDVSDVSSSLAVAAALLPDDIPAIDEAEESLWIGGVRPAVLSGPEAPNLAKREVNLPRSAAFPTTGYYVSRSRSGDHLVFDAGRQGFLNGGHSHADALAVTMSVRWHRFLIDTGTGTYTMDAAARDRFRSTPLHNTLVLDGRSQADPQGPFHWRTLVDAEPRSVALNPRFDFFEGSHDAYHPIIHRRAVFAAGGDFWLIADHVLRERLHHPRGTNRGNGQSARDVAQRQAGGVHSAAVHWHLDPDWRTCLDERTIEAIHRDDVRVAMATTAPHIDLFHGDPATGLGWCSPAYGSIVACATIRFSVDGMAPFSVATVIVPAFEAADVSVTPVAVVGDLAGYAYAVRVVRPDAVDLALFAVPPDDMPGVRGGAAAESRDAGRAVWQSAGIETDARFAHIRLSPAGRVEAASMVDGSALRHAGCETFELRAERVVHDLSLGAEADGHVDISSSGTPGVLTFAFGARTVTSVAVNERPIEFVQSDGVVTCAAGITARAESEIKA